MARGLHQSLLKISLSSTLFRRRSCPFSNTIKLRRLPVVKDDARSASSARIAGVSSAPPTAPAEREDEYFQRAVNDASIDVFVDAGTPSDDEDDHDNNADSRHNLRSGADDRRCRALSAEDAGAGSGLLRSATAASPSPSALGRLEADRLNLGLTRRCRFGSDYYGVGGTSAFAPASAPGSALASPSPRGSAATLPRAAPTFLEAAGHGE